MRFLFTLKSKTVFVVIFLQVVGIFFSHAQKVTYTDSWSKQGFTVHQTKSSGLTLNFSVSDFSFNDQMVKGESMQSISLGDNFLPNEEGCPNLPTVSKFIIIPNGAKASVKVKNIRQVAFEGKDIIPAYRIPKDDDNTPLRYEKNTEVYSKNAFYPEKVVSVSEPMVMRGLTVVAVSVSPFRYNPVSKQLELNRDIELDVQFEGGSGYFGDDRLRSPQWDAILTDNVLNGTSLPYIDYDARKAQQLKSGATGCEYLIISPTNPEFLQWADSLKQWRTQQGILTKVVTLDETGAGVEDLKSYIRNAYQSWEIPPIAILFLGDYGTDPTKSVTSPIWDSYCVSDNIFVDFDNNDLPEIATARMTANNAQELETMVTKCLSYERNPPMSPSFYQSPITALGWQTERWFQLCSEVIGGYWKHQLGKTPNRINAVYGGSTTGPWSTAQNTQTVLDYFGPNGTAYIPATPSELGGFTGGNAAQIVAGLNAGTFMLVHRDHGMETGWGEPDFTNSNISQLTNTDLSFIMSVNCLTGKYNYSSECFAEKFHRYRYNGKNAGALALIAASETSYSFVNDVFVWGMFDYLWPNFMPDQTPAVTERGFLPTFANCAGKYHLAQSNWPYNTSNKVVTYHLFHMHGDAFQTVYTEVPQAMVVTYDPVFMYGLPSFSVKAPAGAKIALSYNGNILGTATATGGFVSVPVTGDVVIGDKITICVTKDNFLRYTAKILVISTEPALVYNNNTVSEVEGNHNGVLDYGETVDLSVEVKNLGSVDATTSLVKLRCNDPYVTIIDSVENYGAIASNATKTIENGFRIKIADNIPHNYNIPLSIYSKGNDFTLSSYFELNCNAPAFTMNNFIIDDAEGGNNNGRIDPDETVKMKFTVVNAGKSATNNAVVKLGSSTGLIAITPSKINIGTLNQWESKQIEFTVTVGDNVPAGMLVDFIGTALQGQNDYLTETVYSQKIGSVVEDWELGHGNTDLFNWSSASDWTISNEAYQGIYAMKSAPIANGGSSTLTCNDYVVPVDDTLSFYMKVSSDQGDKLTFYVDTKTYGPWSGEVPWQQIKVPVTKGTHKFKWIYKKDASGLAGADAAWIDQIEFPTPAYPSVNAGSEAFVCKAASFNCLAYAKYYTVLKWTTTGTGTFSDASVLRPVYIPSAADIAAGSVKLKLTLDPGNHEVSDEMTLTIGSMTAAPQKPVGPAVVNASATPVSQYTVTDVYGADSYQWQLTPGSAGTIVVSGQNAAVTWAPGYQGNVQLQVKALNSCEATDWSEALMVDLQPVSVDKHLQVGLMLYPNPNKGTFKCLITASSRTQATVTVTNALGMRMFEKKNVVCDGDCETSFTLQLPSGVYFFIVKTDKGESITKQFVVM